MEKITTWNGIKKESMSLEHSSMENVLEEDEIVTLASLRLHGIIPDTNDGSPLPESPVHPCSPITC